MSTLSILPTEIPTHPEVLKNRIVEPVNNIEQYASVVKSNLGRNKIWIGAEVDCAEYPKSTRNPLNSYIELKTSRVMKTDKERMRFER